MVPPGTWRSCAHPDSGSVGAAPVDPVTPGRAVDQGGGSGNGERNGSPEDRPGGLQGVRESDAHGCTDRRMMYDVMMCPFDKVERKKEELVSTCVDRAAALGGVWLVDSRLYVQRKRRE